MQGKPCVVTLLCDDKYQWKYVENLQRAVDRNTTVDYDFVVLTDKTPSLRKTYDIPDGRRIMIPDDRIPINGWWWKLWMFGKECREQIGEDRPFLWMDLDTVIVDNIDPLLQLENFTILRDAYAHNQWGSGLMFVPPGVGYEVWSNFDSEVVQRGDLAGRRGGDQVYLRHLYNRGLFDAGDSTHFQDEFPDKIRSFKVTSQKVGQEKAHEDAWIVFFHGRPRPHEVAELPWMVEHWR